MSTNQNSKNFSKKIPPVFILLTSLFLFIISRVIFSNEAHGPSVILALVDVAALLFFLLGIAASISNHFSKKRAVKNSFSAEDKNNNIKLRPIIKKLYYFLIILVVILIPVIYFVLNSEEKEEVAIPKKEVEIVNVSTTKEMRVVIPKKEMGVINVSATKEVKAQVSYDGKYNYSVSIPSGNNSTCIWTYEAGSGRIPYKEITEARTTTEKHMLSLFGDEEYLKIICVDDFGDNYKVIIPK